MYFILKDIFFFVLDTTPQAPLNVQYEQISSNVYFLGKLVMMVVEVNILLYGIV